RTLLRRSDALLQFAHFRREVRLISHGRRHTAQQRGYFGSGLREAEDVVDKEQRVRAFVVTEVLGNRQSGQRDAQTGSWGLGHLSVDQRGLRLRRIARSDNSGLTHFQPEIVALTSTLTDAG